MPTERLSKFVFEIASSERISILRALHERPLRHSEIAELLSLTGSETTRHLSRLTSIGMIEKDPEGRYRAKNLSEALLVGLPFLDFLSRREAYLVGHDTLPLGPSFVARLGELNEGLLIDGTYPVIAA